MPTTLPRSLMPSANKTKLTRERIRQIRPPAKGEFTVWDTEVTGLGVRCLQSGVKSFIVAYRAGYGRSGVARRMTLGKVESLRLEDAREAALDIRARVLRGEDPVVERRELLRAAARPEMSISAALDRYDAAQERRGVIKRESVQSTLRRHLLGHLGDIPLASVDRRAVVEAIEALQSKNLMGSAKELQSRSSTFLKWCADQGYIGANPMQGYKAPRSTRAQKIAKPGRELSDSELAKVWKACDAENINRSFGHLIRMLILTGQRRTETAKMRWTDINESVTFWTIPEDHAKNGIAHEVPLPPLAQKILKSVPRHDDCEYVFSTNGRSPISGWSKLEPKLRDNADVDAAWTLHDLRRTFRTGLTRLGVHPDISEIMLNHRPETLRSIYDRDPRLGARTEAAERWANHVAAILDPDSSSNIVPLKGTA